MTDVTLTVNPFGEGEVVDAEAVLTLAFVDDPVARWMYPTATLYTAKFSALIHAFGRDAFSLGTGYRTRGWGGVALWLPPGSHTDDDALAFILQNDLPGGIRQDALSLFGATDSYHPSEPHWYLPLIGVDPVVQGRGHGSALLEEGLAVCDEQHLPAYLESTNPKNIPLYSSYGFAALGTVQPGAAPPMVPMLRVPR